jgi:hypothetical protein
MKLRRITVALKTAQDRFPEFNLQCTEEHVVDETLYVIKSLMDKAIMYDDLYERNETQTNLINGLYNKIYKMYEKCSDEFKPELKKIMETKEN